MTISALYGFGQPITNLQIDSAVKAVYYEMIGQTFAVLGMAIAKISLGLFLLRIVVKQWHRISIWFCMVTLAAISVTTSITFWLQRYPAEAIYDPRVPGRTLLSVTPFALALGIWCAVVDFYLALLPWIFIWNLNMKFKEKMSIAISLSLGFIACACGIIRSVDIVGMNSSNYTEATIGLIVWSAVELAVTLICVGIPTVRPLYRVIVHGSKPESSNGRYNQQPGSDHSSRFRMRNLMKDNSLFSMTQEGQTESYITRNDNKSDEEVLVGHNGTTHDGIIVREDVTVETGKRY
ncbi:unnamed protein product [Penicillium pancosmium]